MNETVSNDDFVVGGVQAHSTGPEWASGAAPKPKSKPPKPAGPPWGYGTPTFTKPAFASKLDRTTQEEWDAMDGKSRWDSIVALRGPDLINSTVVKFFTSSVVRYKLGAIMRTGGVINNNLPFVVLPAGASFSQPGNVTFDWSHFLGHIYEAALILKIPIVWVTKDVWKNAVGGWSFENVLAAAYTDPLTSFPDGAKEFVASFLTKYGVSIPSQENL